MGRCPRAHQNCERRTLSWRPLLTSHNMPRVALEDDLLKVLDSGMGTGSAAMHGSRTAI